MSLDYNNDNSYLYANKTEIYKFKAYDNICWYDIFLRYISKGFTKDEQGEITLNCAVSDISVDYSSIEKEDILNNHEDLMVKNNTK